MILVLIFRCVADAHDVVYAAKDTAVGKILHRKSAFDGVFRKKITRCDRKEKEGGITVFYRKIEHFLGFREIFGGEIIGFYRQIRFKNGGVIAVRRKRTEEKCRVIRFFG